mgnify:CR=1 FL=1
MKEELDGGPIGTRCRVSLALCSGCRTPETGIRFQYLYYQYRSQNPIWHVLT